MPGDATTTSDPAASEPVSRWRVWLTVAYLRLIRHAVLGRVLPPRLALRLTAPFYQAEVPADLDCLWHEFG
jgi:hypothetical protein